MKNLFKNLTFLKVLNILLVSYSCNLLSQNNKIERLVALDFSNKVNEWINLAKLPNPQKELTIQEQADKKKMKEVSQRYIDRAKEIIAEQIIPNDNEIRSYFFLALGISYGWLENYNEEIKYCKKAEEYALLDSENCFKYLVLSRMFLAQSYMLTKKYDLALPLWKIIIENYQGVGDSTLKNYLAAGSVRNYRIAAEALDSSNVSLKNFLSQISQKYANEVGCAADVQMLQIAKKEKNKDQIEELKKRILNRYPKIIEYERLYQNEFKNY